MRVWHLSGLKKIQGKEIQPNPAANVTHYLTISYLAQLVINTILIPFL